jgi:uncharacterized membrane protein YgcG
MKKYLQALMVMVATLFATNALAFTAPPSPKPEGNIVDQAGILTPREVRDLNLKLNQVNSNSANEIAILIVKSLDGENIRDIGLDTGRAWGVGKKGLDNGVIIVWSPGDRKIGIETGKGVEGDLPDLKCNDIIRQVMGPQFRDKQYAQGLGGAIDSISSSIADHRAAVAQQQAHAQADSQHATPHQSGDCSMAVQQAGLGGSFFWIILMTGFFFFLHSRAKARARSQEKINADARLLLKQRQQEELERINAAQRALQREQQARMPTPAVTVTSTPVIRPIATAPLITPTPAAPTDEVLARLRQEQQAEQERQERSTRLEQERQEREQTERRQAHLRQLEEERTRREREESDNTAAVLAATALAAATSSSSNDDDDDDSGSNDSGSDDDSGSSSSSDSDPSPDFGGGDFGGGGSSSDY